MVYPLIWLATLYKEGNNETQAEIFSQRALYILKQVSHFTYLDFADTLHDLATLQQTRGHDDEARSLYKHALVLRRQTLGSEHFKTAETYRLLVGLLYSMGRMEEVALLEEE